MVGGGAVEDMTGGQAAFLEVEVAAPDAELLDEAGALPDVRAYLRVQGEGVLTALVDVPDFAAWLSKLVG